jgi:hypothetical protein
MVNDFFERTTKRATSTVTARRAGLKEHIHRVSDAGKGRRSVQHIRVVFQSGSGWCGTVRRAVRSTICGDATLRCTLTSIH